MRYRSIVLAAALALAAIGSLGGATAPARAVAGATHEAAASDPVAATAFVIVDHNIEHGNQANLDAAVAQARAKGADALTVQEVCESQVLALSDRYGWRFDFRTMRSRGECPTGNFGDAVFWLSSATSVTAGSIGFRHTNNPNEDPDAVDEGGASRAYGLACLRVVRDGTVYRVCSTHLFTAPNPVDPLPNTVPNLRAYQVRQINDITDAWIDNDVVVAIAGDFNLQADAPAMHPLYSASYTGGAGRFREADPCACRVPPDVGAPHTRSTVSDPTRLAKPDYVFYSQNRSGSPRSLTVCACGSASDHLILTASMMTRVT